jgi:outer membrane lipopolysaccharide assembly protein LptE/RlpB
MRQTLLILFILTIFSTACGYRFTGGGLLPGDKSTIAVEIFRNRTAQTGLETTLTNDLLFQFTRAEAIRVTTLSESETLLRGTIQRLVLTPIAYTGTSTTTQQRAILTVDFSLFTTGDSRLLWEKKGISEEEAFDVGDDKTETSANLEAALETVSKRMAERVYNLMTSDF